MHVVIVIHCVVGKRSLMMNFSARIAANNRYISSSFRDVSNKRHILLR